MRFLPVILSILFSSALFFSGCGRDLVEEGKQVLDPLHSITFESNQLPETVIGQANFFSGNSGLSQTRFNTPVGIAASESGALYVSDSINHRVMGFNSLPSSQGASADFVIGQTNFTSSSQGVSATTMKYPVGLAYDSGKLFVPDMDGNRVLIYDTAPVSTGAAASVVVGQASMTTSTSLCAADGLTLPQSVFAGAGKLIISDTFFSRVLIYNSIPTSSGASADLILGRNDFSTCAGTISPSSNLLAPLGVWSDGIRLVIADQNYHRVLIWNTFPTVNNQPADIVLGQFDMTMGTPNNSGLSARSLSSPAYVTSNGKQLFVSDRGNNRVLIWNTFPTSNFEQADVVLGQPSFTTNEAATTVSGMSGPRQLQLAGNKLIVADSANNRVLVFKGIQ